MSRRAGSVIRYQGSLGAVLRLRYRDADGERVIETLGREADGWSASKAEEELRSRLVDVKRERRRKLKPATFDEFAEQWYGTYPDLKGLKRSTRRSYRQLLDLHLLPAFGELRLELLDLDRLDRYMAAKRSGDGALGPASVNRHLNLLNLILTSAIKRGALRPNANPVPLVDRPKEPRRRWAILTPAEIGRVSNAFLELAEKTDDERRRKWLLQSRVLFMVSVACGLRRGELLGLRWRHVDFVDVVLRIEETWVRGAVDTPKSEAGERTIAVSQVIASELFDHRARTAFEGDDELLFCHPETGRPLDDHHYPDLLREALGRAKVTKKMRPFHDGRHTAITNDAASGNAPVSIQARAGHASFSTTQRYIDLAGVTFREEAERSSARLFGGSGKSSGKSAEVPDQTPQHAD